MEDGTSPSLPVALTLAGSDCSAGAGLQADLKTFSALGVYGLTVATSVVAETPAEVAEILPLPPSLVARQCDLLLSSFPVRAVKTGLLGSREIVETLTDRLALFAGPVVIDPVSVASAGPALGGRELGEALRGLILRTAFLATPNRAEAEALLGEAIAGPEFAREAALRLSDDLGCAVLLKGGHFDGPESTDWLAHEGGLEAIRRVRLPGGTSLHGTGCTYAAAIAAGLALGRGLLEAVEQARSFLHAASEHAYSWDAPDGSVMKALAHERARVQS